MKCMGRVQRVHPTRYVNGQRQKQKVDYPLRSLSIGWARCSRLVGPNHPPPLRPTHRSAAAPMSLGFVRVTQKNVCSKNGRRRHDLYGHYTGNYVTLHRYMVTTKAFVGTSLNVFFPSDFFIYACVCVSIHLSVFGDQLLCFVLMFSVINSPLVGLLICIFTYLHSLLVAACHSPSASGEIASGHTSSYITFCSISSSPEGQLALFLLKHSFLAPRRCCEAAGHIQKSAERK